MATRKISAGGAVRLFLVALLWMTGDVAAEELRIGVQPADPPFIYTDSNGELRGFDIDIARALCEKIDAECRLVPTDWEDLIPSLREGRLEAVVSSLSITDKRRKLVDFTQKYYESPARFIARRDSDIEISEAGLKGRVIGVKRGTTWEDYVTDNYQDIADIRRYGQQEDALVDLVLGRLDLVFGDSIANRENFLNRKVGRDFEFVGPALSDPRWFGHGLGIAVRKRDSRLRDRLNKAIRAIRADGTYLQIQDRYFSYDIYNGGDEGSSRRKARLR